MENFGDRLTAIRQELGLSQTALAESVGISQPQLSKLEKGARVAGADVIDKIAAALQRCGLDLVRGTDREGAYTAARLTPEDRAADARQILSNQAVAVTMLADFYVRVVRLFEAMYGSGVVPSVDAEGLYIDMRGLCTHLASAVYVFRSQASETLYFPDHIVPESEDDDLLMAYDFYFKPELQKARRAVMTLESEYRPFVTAEMRVAMQKDSPLGLIDEQIRLIEVKRKKAEETVFNEARP